MKKIKIFLMLLLGVGSNANAQSQTNNPPLGRAWVGSLEQCLDSARTHNRALKNAAIEIERAKDQKSEAYTKYYPEISANVIAFHAFDKMIKGSGTYPEELAALEPLMPGISQMVGQKFEFGELNRGYMISVSVMQPVYTGGRLRMGNQLAELQQDVMTLQLQMKEKEVEEKVIENYCQIAQLSYNLQTLDAADRQLKGVHDHVEKYVKAGITTSNDLLKVQLRQQELLSNRLKVENGIRVLKLLLAQQCGIEGNFKIELPERKQISLASSVDASTKASQRVEYLLSQKAVEAERIQVEMERAKRLPTVAVGLMGSNVGLGGFSSNVRHNMNTNITNGLVLATVSVPISDWWKGKHSIHRQELKVEQAKNDSQEALEMLTIDIESAWNNLQEAVNQISVAETSVTQAEENLRQSTERYNAGTEDITDLLDAETLHRQSQNNLSSAFASYLMALKKYQLKCPLLTNSSGK